MALAKMCSMYYKYKRKRLCLLAKKPILNKKGHMPSANDVFITTLKKAHLEWGSHRHTLTRDIIYGEGYLQIPAREARRLNINNSNLSGGNTIYLCNSSDGFLKNINLKASGSSNAGDIHAKQFHGRGNLKVLGDWFNHVQAQIGDQIEIKWVSPTEVLITKL